jgi:hypothetical protein
LKKGPVQPDGTGQRQHENKLGQTSQHARQVNAGGWRMSRRAGRMERMSESVNQ